MPTLHLLTSYIVSTNITASFTLFIDPRYPPAAFCIYFLNHDVLSFAENPIYLRKLVIISQRGRFTGTLVNDRFH